MAALARAEHRPDSIVVPKVQAAGDLVLVDQVIDAAETAAGAGSQLTVQALIETALGISSLSEIVACSSRLSTIVLGYADLAVSLGRSPAGVRNLDLWLAMQDAVLVAARSARLHAIDGPFLAIGDAVGLRAAATRAFDLGFDGKWAIHPSQLGPIVESFTPSFEDVAHAEAVLAALDGVGDGAVSLDGEMIDEPVRLAALRVLARAGRDMGGLR